LVLKALLTSESTEMMHKDSIHAKLSLRHGDYNPEPSTFKVIIPSVPMWKIRSIANFKKKTSNKPKIKETIGASHEVKKELCEQEKQTVTYAQTERVNSLPSYASTSELGAVGRMRKGKFLAPEVLPVVPDASMALFNASLPEPVVGALHKENTILSQTPEDFKHKNDSLIANMQICKHQMIALEKVRTNMVWLLEKATLFETQKNHSDLAMDSVNRHPKKRQRLQQVALRDEL
jgi:hypothetical protein